MRSNETVLLSHTIMKLGVRSGDLAGHVILFQSILQEIDHLRMCEQCCQSVVEPTRFFHEGVC